MDKEALKAVFEEILEAWESGEDALIGEFAGFDAPKQKAEAEAQKGEWRSRFYAALGEERRIPRPAAGGDRRLRAPGGDAHGHAAYLVPRLAAVPCAGHRPPLNRLAHVTSWRTE